MAFLLLVGVVLSAALVASILFSTLLERRTPPALRGDWSTRFEKDFRVFSAMHRGTPAVPQPRSGTTPTITRGTGKALGAAPSNDGHACCARHDSSTVDLQSRGATKDWIKVT